MWQKHSDESVGMKQIIIWGCEILPDQMMAHTFCDLPLRSVPALGGCEIHVAKMGAFSLTSSAQSNHGLIGRYDDTR